MTHVRRLASSVQNSAPASPPSVDPTDTQRFALEELAPSRWPGRRLALEELVLGNCPPIIIAAMEREPAPPFEAGPAYWHLRTEELAIARGVERPDFQDAPVHPARAEWPDAGARPACLDAPDPYPSRAALLRDAFENHNTPTSILEALGAEKLANTYKDDRPIDPGPFYWASRLAALLALRPRVNLPSLGAKSSATARPRRTWERVICDLARPLMKARIEGRDAR